MRSQRDRAEQLFEMFAGPHTTRAEVAAMDVGTLTVQIRELRDEEPDDIPMTSRELATRLLEFARGEYD